MAWPIRLLPGGMRVTLRGLRNDVRTFSRSLREPRFKGGRHREPGWVPPVERERSRVVSAQVEPGVGGVVVFALSGVELELDPGVSILEAGLAAGVDLLFSCTMGGCAACMLEVREGEVEYEDRDAICLTDQEIDEGMCLACVGRPRGRVVVEA